jgi:MFS family permease
MSGSPTHPVLGGPQAWLVWTIAVTFVVYYFSFQTGYAIVNSSVQKDLDLSIAQVGFIAAIYTWVFAICQFLSGSLLDRMGARPILLPSIVLVTIGVFIFAYARNFEMLLLSQACTPRLSIAPKQSAPKADAIQMCGKRATFIRERNTAPRKVLKFCPAGTATGAGSRR